jgi:hypothetical protein
VPFSIDPSTVDSIAVWQTFEILTCYGRHPDSYYWVLIFGPLQDGNLQKEAK